MPLQLNIANVYTFGWCLYFLQGPLYPVGSLFSRLLLVILIFVSLYYCFIANTRYKLPVYFTGLNLLIALFTFYGAHLILMYDPMEYHNPLPRFDYLKSIWISLLPIYAYYVFFKEKKMSEKALYLWFVIFAAIATAGFFHIQRYLLLAAMLNRSNRVEFTNNTGYVFLGLIPACALLYKKPLIQYFAFGYCMIFMLMAMKRGAIIIGSVCLIWFIWNNIKNANVRKKIAFVMLSIFLCFVGYQFVEKQMNESLYFQKRVEDTFEGNSSDRDVIYRLFANYYWNNTNNLQFILGSGADATVKMYDYAHNDWLEIIVNQGLLGILIYIIYWILFFKTVISRNHDPHTKLAIQLLFVIYFMKTIFSMSYIEMTTGATFVLGYCLAKETL